MSAISATLEKENQAYEQSKLVIIDARVDVKFIDLTTDAEIQNHLRRVEIADNKAGGPLFKNVAPEGKTALVKPFGQKQLDALNDLVGRLNALAPTWPAAAQESATIDGLAKSYKAALDSRDNAWQSARNLRIARNLAKQAFITGYLEISFGVKALYPQDKKMQDLFFDEVENEVEKDLGEEPEPEAAPAAPGAAAPDGGSAPV
ncbi:MAG: hypothetical protein ABI134_13255 [Byssovorax sp.]